MKFKLLTTFVFVFLQISTSAQKVISVDFSNETGQIKDLIGVNRYNINMALAYQDAGITLVRPQGYHGPFDYEYYSDFWLFDSINQTFTDLNPDFDPFDTTHYFWQTTDFNAQQIMNIGANIFFRIGFSYYILDTVHPHPPTNPPFDYGNNTFNNFTELCKRTVMHYNEGWDNGYEYNIQYWEIWNEPGGIFWDGTSIDFYRMYQQVADTLKSNFPNIKIGALGAYPSTSLGLDTTYREAFFRYLHQNNVPLDFYSWHLYWMKNPYTYFMLGDTMRNILDRFGFYSAENIISEANYDLNSPIDYSPKGTAYFLSTLIACQIGKVDKIIFYPGPAFFEADSAGQPRYLYSGYALKMFNLLRDNTPITVASTGNEFIETEYDRDTLNIMTLAAKSSDNNKLYILVSNFQSDYSDFQINITNLPWTSQDQITITKNIVNTNNFFDETIENVSGSNSLSLTLSNFTSPSTVIIRIEKNTTNIADSFDNEDEVIISKFNTGNNYLLTILNKETKIKALKIYNLSGEICDYSVTAIDNWHWIFKIKQNNHNILLCKITLEKNNKEKNIIKKFYNN